tara:strand:+ start:527 stop:1165 length:639 start_codon:yes stop_codon:yes gene_type:complete
MEKEESIENNLKENHKETETAESEKTEKTKDVEKTEEKLTPEEELLSIKDKLARTFAEMENQRRRYEKEKEDAFEYGGFSFAREALNLLDNLDRSKISLENDETIKNTETLKKVLEHFEIINKDLLSIFKKNNIEPIKSINEKLDPNLHQAMMEIEDDTKEPGTIVQEVQKGFMMRDRLLRPALVGVAKRKSDEQSKEKQKTQENQAEKDKN